MQKYSTGTAQSSWDVTEDEFTVKNYKAYGENDCFAIHHGQKAHSTKNRTREESKKGDHNNKRKQTI